MSKTVKVPVCEKAYLSLEEASEYFSIGINRLRTLLHTNECQSFVLYVGSKRLIKRKLLEEYLNTLETI